METCYLLLLLLSSYIYIYVYYGTLRTFGTGRPICINNMDEKTSTRCNLTMDQIQKQLQGNCQEGSPGDVTRRLLGRGGPSAPRACDERPLANRFSVQEDLRSPMAACDFADRFEAITAPRAGTMNAVCMD